MTRELLERDAALIWHPFTQIQTDRAPVSIDSASGSLLFTAEGRTIIDAISSWWAVLHGHSEPSIVAAIRAQAERLQHVIFAGCTHRPAVNLAQELLSLLTWQNRVFYSDNGSTAVCTGLKMALQYFSNIGAPRRTILAFENAYHGDTFEAMSLSARSLFTAPFDPFLFEVKRIPVPLPGEERRAIEAMKSLCKGGDAALFIYEPLLMGAGGMLMYRSEPLNDLIKIARSHGTLCFADEVLTGFGRTGTLFASEQMESKPDLMALSKAITGGTLPLGVTTSTTEIFDAFRGEEKSRALLHGHTYTANPLACAAAVANLELCRRPTFAAQLARIIEKHTEFCRHLEFKYGCRTNGMVCALNIEGSLNYSSSIRDRLDRFFIGRDVLLRPLGNVLYTLPPLCISDSELQTVYGLLEEAINLVAQGRI